jgi:hypothetical protein
MRSFILTGVLTGVLTTAAWADIAPHNPINDPDGQVLAGIGVESISVQGCGRQKDISQVLPVVQGTDTFDIQHQFLKLAEYGAPSWVTLPLTGRYSWLNSTMYLDLDDASKTALVASIQQTISTLCQNNAVLIPRSIVVLENVVKISGNKKVSGLLQVKAMYKGDVSSQDGFIIGHGKKLGKVSYSLRIKGGLQ